jgi:hypothetical protein
MQPLTPAKKLARATAEANAALQRKSRRFISPGDDNHWIQTVEISKRSLRRILKEIKGK